MDINGQYRALIVQSNLKSERKFFLQNIFGVEYVLTIGKTKFTSHSRWRSANFSHFRATFIKSAFFCSFWTSHSSNVETQILLLPLNFQIHFSWCHPSKLHVHDLTPQAWRHVYLHSSYTDNVTSRATISSATILLETERKNFWYKLILSSHAEVSKPRSSLQKI